LQIKPANENLKGNFSSRKVALSHETYRGAYMIIQTRNINKLYGKRAVLRDVSVTVEKGKIYGFVGRNGAGKTTFLRVIMGLAAVQSGEIGLFDSFDKKDVTRARLKIGGIIEAPVVYPNMSAYQNMKFAGMAKGAQFESVYRKFSLDNYGNKKARDFSLGMKQRLAIAMAMIGNPELLVLDEPLNGLDPTGIVEINEILRILNAEGVTILISSHILSELARIVSDVIFIDNGAILKQTTLAEIENESRSRVIFSVDNNSLAEEVLRSKGIQTTTEGDKLIINNGMEAYELSKIMFQNNLIITHLSEFRGNLEDYFINLLQGGNR
jgi:ABC-2 type transport system ATP-binding protein